MSRPTHHELQCVNCQQMQVYDGRDEIEIVELVCTDGIMRFYGRCLQCNFRTLKDPTVEAVVWRWRKAWREHQEASRAQA